MNGSVKVARIMLNMLGLALEDGEKEELEIYDQSNNLVGKLADGKDIFIQANINDSILSASLKTVKQYARLNNRRSALGSPKREYFFDFKIANKDLNVIDGRINIIPYPNPANLRCECLALLHYSDAEGKKIQIRSDGSVPLLVKINDKDRIEKLLINFNDNYRIGISHHIEEDYDDKTHSYRLGQALDLTDCKNYLNVKLTSKGYDEFECPFIQFKEICEAKEYENKWQLINEPLMIQKGNLANKYDPTISEYINYLCNEPFMIGDVSLFKNLISMCFDKYSDEVFEALFQTERNKELYQDGSINLTDAYFDLKKWENVTLNKRR